MGGVLVYAQRLLDGDFHYGVYHVSYVYRVSYPRVTLSSQMRPRARNAMFLPVSESSRK